MTKFVVIHRELSDLQIDAINMGGGWSSDVGKAYMKAEDGDCADAIERGMYRVVAIVEADCVDGAYERTNSIWGPWQENSGILWSVDRAKSSSMGDIFINLETLKVELVAMFGFDSLEGNSADTFRSMAEVALENQEMLEEVLGELA